MTGILSWTAEATAFGIVVSIEQFSTALPVLSDSSEREQFPLVYLKTERLFHVAPALPLVKPVRWDEAPATAQWVTERWLCRCCLRPCVNHLCGDRLVLRPRGDQAPTHQRQFPARFLRILPDHWNGLSRGNVVTRSPVFI
jgi:hypothetical protein